MWVVTCSAHNTTGESMMVAVVVALAASRTRCQYSAVVKYRYMDV
jgi:hypothetical protein